MKVASETPRATHRAAPSFSPRPPGQHHQRADERQERRQREELVHSLVPSQTRTPTAPRKNASAYERTNPVWTSADRRGEAPRAGAHPVHEPVHDLRVEHVRREPGCRRSRVHEQRGVRMVDVPAVPRGARERLEPLAEREPFDPAGGVDPPGDRERAERDRGRDRRAGRSSEAPSPAGTGPVTGSRTRASLPSEEVDSTSPARTAPAARIDERDRHHRRRLVCVLGLLAPRRSRRTRGTPAARCRARTGGRRASRGGRSTCCPVWFANSRIWSFAKKPASGKTPARANAPTTNVHPVDRHPSDQPAHPLQVGLLVHPVHHGARAQEHQRLVERVGDEHEHRARVEAHARGHEHEPELADRGVGEDALDVVLRQRARRREQRRHQPDDQHDGQGDAGELEERRAPDDEVDAGGHHRRGVDQGGDRGRAGHRVGQPDVERHLRRLPDRPANRSSEIAVAVPFAIVSPGAPSTAREVERAELRHDQRQADQHRGVADACRDERLLRGARVLGLLEPEADQQVRAEADALPAHVQEEVVVRQDQQEHEEHEQVQVGEEPPVPRVSLHVADRVDVDQEPDPGDDQDHHRGQDVEAEIRPDREPAHRDPVEEVGDPDARIGRQPQQIHDQDEREHERQRDRPCGEDPREPPDSPTKEQVAGRDREGDQRDEPEERETFRALRGLHQPARPLASSTSTVPRRR